MLYIRRKLLTLLSRIKTSATERGGLIPSAVPTTNLYEYQMEYMLEEGRGHIGLNIIQNPLSICL